MMYSVNYKERTEEDVTLAGATKTTVRWLIGKRTGARTYAMRMFTMLPGGLVPLHSHSEEHEIFVLQGQAKLLGGSQESIVRKDDVVFIPSDEEHGYDNTEGKENFRFICVIPLLEEK
jgi:quercetin dioxygenase-like cupin family protein